METRKFTTILMSLIMLGIASGESVKKVDHTPTISNTLTASCLVKLTADPEFLPLDLDTIDQLLRSSGIHGKAVREILELKLYNGPNLFTIKVFHGKHSRVPSVTLYDTEPLIQETGSRARTTLKSMPGLMRRGGFAKPSAKPQPKPSASSDSQTIIFELQVDLSHSKDVKPVAQEFMNAMTDNFRRIILKAFHQDYKSELSILLEYAGNQRYEAQSDILHDGDNYATKRQLDQIVDLSALTLDTPLYKAIEILKNSVNPPLKIAVLWSELSDNAFIDRDFPISMDGISSVPLGKGLEILLKSLSTLAEIEYQIDKGVITIATKESLPKSSQELLQQTAGIYNPMELDHEQKQSFLATRLNLEADIARMQAQSSAIEQEIAKIKTEVVSKVKNDTIAGELQRIVEMQIARLEKIEQSGQHGGKQDQEEKLARAKIELARRREEIGQSAGGNRLDEFNRELTQMRFDLTGDKATFRVISEHIKKAESQFSTTRDFDPKTSQIRASIKAFEIAENRFNELKLRITNIQPPTIIILGE